MLVTTIGGSATRPPAGLHGRYRFFADIIRHAAWLYHVFSFGLRDVELIASSLS